MSNREHCVGCRQGSWGKLNPNNGVRANPVCCLCEGFPTMCKYCFDRDIGWMFHGDDITRVLDYKVSDDEYEMPFEVDEEIAGTCDAVKNDRALEERVGDELVTFATCFGSIPALRYAIQSGMPVDPFAVHMLLQHFEKCWCKYRWPTVNKRIDVLMSTGKMLPDAEFSGKTAADIIHSFPADLKAYLTSCNKMTIRVA